MPEWGEELLESKDNPAEYEDYLRESEQRLKTETDPRWRAILESSIRKIQFQMRSLPELDLRYSNQTFDGKMDSTEHSAI